MKTDKEIQQDVLEEIKWEPLLKSADIGAYVKDGIVTLTGVVDSYTKKLSAERAAKRVSGVSVVVENIVVRIDEKERKSDAEIEKTVRNALKWNTMIPDENINITVQDGWVTLEGETEWEYQKTAAQDAIESLLGVVGVDNKIQIKSRVTPVAIKDKIKAALVRSASVDSEKITIETHDGTVILSGKVRSWAEKKDAEAAAWLAPGVTRVQNNIEVDAEVFAH